MEIEKIKTLFQHRFVILFCSLILLMIGTPLIPIIMPGTYPKLMEIMVAILFAWVLLSAVFAITKTRNSMIIGIGLVVPAILSHMLYLGTGQTGFLISYYVFDLAFLSYVIAMIFKILFTSQKINLNTIFAALCIYLLLGVLWSIGYSLSELFMPGAFSITAASEDTLMFGNRGSSFSLYYSFVTMSTLGYGDIVPKYPFVRMLAVTQAITGQLYLSVLVARLVGLYTTQQKQKT